MAPQGSRLEWHGADVLALADKALDEMVSKLALQTVGHAQVNAAVDTGFMRNTIYAITPRGTDAQGWGSGTYQDRTGNAVQRTRVYEQPPIGEHEAAVHVAADYAIWRELADNFVSDALQQAGQDLSQVATEVGKDTFG